MSRFVPITRKKAREYVSFDKTRSVRGNAISALELNSCNLITIRKANGSYTLIGVEKPDLNNVIKLNPHSDLAFSND